MAFQNLQHWNPTYGQNMEGPRGGHARTHPDDYSSSLGYGNSTLLINSVTSSPAHKHNQGWFQPSEMGVLPPDSHLRGSCYFPPVMTTQSETRSGTLVEYNYIVGRQPITPDTQSCSEPSKPKLEKACRGGKWEMSGDQWCYEDSLVKIMIDRVPPSPAADGYTVDRVEGRKLGPIYVLWRNPPAKTAGNLGTSKPIPQAHHSAPHASHLTDSFPCLRAGENLSDLDEKSLIERRELSEAVYKHLARRIPTIECKQNSLESQYPTSKAVIGYASGNAERISLMTKAMNEHKALVNEIDGALNQVRNPITQAQVHNGSHEGTVLQGESEFYDAGFPGNMIFHSDRGSCSDNRFQGEVALQGDSVCRNIQFPGHAMFPVDRSPYGDIENHHNGYRRTEFSGHKKTYWGFENYKTRKSRDWVYRGDANG